MLFAYFY